MGIISLSLDETSEEKIDELQRMGSFNGRSELIRTAVANLHRDMKLREKLEGKLNAVIVVKHPHSKEHDVAHTFHEYDEILNTQLHSKLDEGKCLEVLHTEGSANRIMELFNELEGSKHTEHVEILPQN
ncbi:CopG family ribbon-helix-helix protein [Candidatus Nanohalococcus occultus]|uniref:Transcriptional regulator, CopG/Arc/MetJ family (DNA-binding and a metal-binding domains) n=1 Tax=Candidatus Nanohalococcus occultus TaxID=2978047 RepID=A0ABY8CJ90_9ARCH|nr:Transcriptional regulator, CopG/Arc/MetJ family (DNA-binding and a metal-binding domains) [Candidatus Nanohaloarchaeota archaeon SVXNc]